MRVVILTVLALLTSATSCRTATAPATPLVAVSVEAIGSGSDVTVSVDARVRSVVIAGRAGLTCGASAATGRAELRGERLRIYLSFEPLGSCPFAPSNPRFTAVVTEVPAGLYDAEVIVKYLRDEPSWVLAQASVSVQDW